MTSLMKLIDERIEHCFNTSSHNEGDYTAFDALRALKTAVEAIEFYSSRSQSSELTIENPENVFGDTARQALTQIETQMKGE